MLTINNASVALSAGALLFVLLYKGSEMAWAGPVVTGVALAVGAISAVAGTATKIIITRDWIVVICDSNRDMLAGEFWELIIGGVLQK